MDREENHGMNRVDWTLLVFVVVGSVALSFIGRY